MWNKTQEPVAVVPVLSDLYIHNYNVQGTRQRLLDGFPQGMFSSLSGTTPLPFPAQHPQFQGHDKTLLYPEALSNLQQVANEDDEQDL